MSYSDLELERNEIKLDILKVGTPEELKTVYAKILAYEKVTGDTIGGQVLRDFIDKHVRL